MESGKEERELLNLNEPQAISVGCERQENLFIENLPVLEKMAFSTLLGMSLPIIDGVDPELLTLLALA